MEYINSIQMLWTLVAFVIFIGIFIWAMSGKRDEEFDDASHLVFDENDDPKLKYNHKPKSGN